MGSPTPKDRLERGDFEAIVFQCDEDTRKEFLDALQAEADEVVDGLVTAYEAISTEIPLLQGDMRAAWIEGFLFNALDCVGTSTKLLLMGLLVPAGNLMRQFGEACAMALLCSHEKLDTVERLESKHGFPTHKAIREVSTKKSRTLLGIEGEGWKTFTDITKWYDKFSHASRLGLAATLLFKEPGGYILGGGFDEEKLGEYRKELRLRVSACGVLRDLTRHVRELAQAAQAKGLLQRDST